MRYLEDWQLKMLQDGLNEEAVVEEYASKHNVHDLMAVPASWLEPLLAEVRASRLSGGRKWVHPGTDKVGHWEYTKPKAASDPLWEAVQKVGKDLDEQAHKRHCPECGSAKLEKGTFVFCFDCHEYRELP